jgi:hypothetical protein
MDILSGLEDVPKIADEHCSDCGVLLTADNFDGWFKFVRNDGQMYQVPICNDCDKKDSAGGAKVSE